MKPLLISEKDQLLIIAPHPDDECIGPGGLLAFYKGRCQVWVLTDGAIGQRDIQPEKCRCIRKHEFMDEMSYLALSSDHYKLLECPDGLLHQNISCLEDYDLSQFTKIFVTGKEDHHADHMAAFRCVVYALKQQHVRNVEVYCYEVHNAMVEPTHYFDITEMIDEKIRLIQFHKSQLGELPYDSYARVAAQYRALQNRMAGKYIEVYTKITDYDNHKDSGLFQEIEDLQKFKLFYSVLTVWLSLPSKECCCKFLYEKSISSCVIYGYAELGKILYKCLKKCGIQVPYILDAKKAGSKNEDGIQILAPRKRSDADLCVLVTAVYYFDEIRQKLLELGYRQVISLKEIIEKSR